MHYIFHQLKFTSGEPTATYPTQALVLQHAPLEILNEGIGGDGAKTNRGGAIPDDKRGRRQHVRLHRLPRIFEGIRGVSATGYGLLYIVCAALQTSK